MTLNHLTRWLLPALLLLAAWSPPALAAGAAGSQSFDGVIGWPNESARGRAYHPDADTPRVVRADGESVKVRLHYADAPEVSRAKREVDQPGGKESLSYAKQKWEGKTVTVTPKGQSYGRLVGDIEDKETHKSLGLDLVSTGHAQVDPRFHPPRSFVAAESEARKAKIGLWAAEKVTAPWVWRAQQRERGRKK